MRQSVMSRLAPLLAAGLLVAACYTGPGAEHFAAVLDELTTPDDWDLVGTKSRPSEEDRCDPIVTLDCPAVIRFYQVDGDPSQAFTVAKQVAAAAGFQVDREFIPACDGPPSGAACTFHSTKDTDRVKVAVFPPGRYAGLDDAPADRTTVVVTATRSQ